MLQRVPRPAGLATESACVVYPPSAGSIRAGGIQGVRQRGRGDACVARVGG